MQMNERVLVIGATRGTGLLIANLLRERGYRVRAVARNEVEAKRRLGAEVEVVPADITKPETLRAVLQDVNHIVFTAGVTKRPASEQLVRTTEYDGVRNTLAAGKQAGFGGRFLYMTSIGGARPSLGATLLNLVKRNTLLWRSRAEDEIRRSGLPYTIIRAGFLTNARGGRRAIDVSQSGYPLVFKYRIARADVADAFVAALEHPRTVRTTFEVVWVRAARRESWDVLFSGLKPDA